MVSDGTRWIMFYIIIIAVVLMCLYGAVKVLETLRWI